MYDLLVQTGLSFDAEEVVLVLNLNIQQGDFLTMKKASGADLLFVNWGEED